jgi:CheY-like chemotaxis protein
MALTSLLVCADAKAVHVLNRLLQDLGMRVELCGDPSLAVSRLSEQTFDVLVADFKDQAGAIRLTTHARNTLDNKNVAVVALVDSENDVREIFAQGANFILYKPISAERASTSLQAARSLIRNERRVTRRVPVDSNASIAYANIENVAVQITDLSEEGVSILSKQRLPAGGKVYLQFALPGDSSSVHLSGEVKWQDTSGRVGIRFVDVPKASQRLINQWLGGNIGKRPELTVSMFPEAGHAPTQAETNLAAGLGLMSVSAGDRRGRSRRPCCIGVEVYRFGQSIPHRCTLTDLSPGGCYIESSEPFAPGIPVEILIRTHDLKLRMEGKVTSTHPGFGMGVQFTLRTEGQREQVRQLLTHQSAPPKLSLETI